VTKLRNLWLAGFGAVLLVALSASGAFAARPATPGAAWGLDTAASAISAHNQDEDTDNQDEDTDNQDETDNEDEINQPEGNEDGAGGAHGACVSAVARGDVVLDGEYANHGAMVSYAARVTCWQPPEASPTSVEHKGPPAWVLERKAGGSTTAALHTNGHGKGKALGHSR
jgi:hypothetical protein